MAKNPTRTVAGVLDSPLLGWAIVTSLVAWGFFVLWRAGMLSRLTEEDPSRLSWVILALYAATQLYAGALALGLHRDRRTVGTWLDGRRDAPAAGHDIVDYLARGGAGQDDEEYAYLRALVTDRLSSGWFIADLMFKLGLLGTVIGFIIMLGAITDLRSMDLNQAQQMLGDMSAGMRLALYTTLTGLACGALVGVQFHLLERSGETLARRAVARRRRDEPPVAAAP